MGDFPNLERPGPEAVCIDGVELRRGSRVRLRPGAGADVFDLMLADKTAVVAGFDQDLEGNIKAAVVVEQDPGSDLGSQRQIGHRFFFSVDELEPLSGPGAQPQAAQILVAGIGNIFLGDDAFGVELAARLRDCALAPGVEVIDFGIRGMDLAYALQEDYRAVIILDATPRGQAPGTLYVIEPELDPDEVALDAHGLDPQRVLGLARHMGRVPERILVVGCEPETHMTGEETELVGKLSAPVQAVMEEAVSLVRSLLDDLAGQTTAQKEQSQ